jgi:hypothetical protein
MPSAVLTSSILDTNASNVLRCPASLLKAATLEAYYSSVSRKPFASSTLAL